MKKHVLVILAENKPGVLHRVTSLCRQRQFNIENLSAGHTEQKGVSHMTMVIDAKKTNVEQVVKQLYKLIDVVKVTDLNYDQALTKETALIKVESQRENRQELLHLAEAFQCKVVHLSSQCIIFELTGSSEKIEDFTDISKEFGLLEIKRTGVIAMSRE